MLPAGSQCSSRATITSSRFQVDYSWGSFKGNADEWMERYFDAFLYLANWGTRELMLRVPRLLERGILPFKVFAGTRYIRSKDIHAFILWRRPA